MKTITYTQMRKDLSSLLDDIRNGESITITQRGKPDLVITGKQVDISVSDNADDGIVTCNKVSDSSAMKSINLGKGSAVVSIPLESIFSPENIKSLEKLGEAVKNLQPSPEAIEGIQRVATKLNTMLASKEVMEFYHRMDEIQSKLESSTSMDQFRKALDYSKNKYAHIIKSLEDK